MNQTNPHKHAAIIKAWADGAEVEYRILGQTEFYGQPCPGFNGIGEYRIKPAPDKWADLKAAHKLGSVIQYRSLSTVAIWSEWEDTNSPLWLTESDDEYRIKPHDEYAALKAAADAGKIIQTRIHEADYWKDAPVSKRLMWNLGVTNYRVKPETLTYRMAILQHNGNPAYLCGCPKLCEEKTFEGYDSFVRWVGERQTVEV